MVPAVAIGVLFRVVELVYARKKKSRVSSLLNSVQTVFENSLVEHRVVLLPDGMEKDTVLELEFQGVKKQFTMLQLVRTPRPVASKLAADTLLLTGQPPCAAIGNCRRKRGYCRKLLPPYLLLVDNGPDPFILLKAIASTDLWIWHAFFGISGMNNDVNVLRQSPIFNDIKSGRAPDVPFVANDVPYKKGYYLTDEIYL
nr:putative nuclease HARBI1 [Tanacetum cinerariifolium]